VNVGDLVRCHPDVFDDVNQTGIIIEVINSQRSVPSVCKVLWSTGVIDKEWTDDLEVINESR